MNSNKSYLIVAPYIGGILSKNNYKFNNLKRTTKPEVKVWKDYIEVQAEHLNIPSGRQEYSIEVSGIFSDNRYPDIHNLFEVIADSLEKPLKRRDKYFKLSTGHVGIDPFKGPQILIIITPSEL